MPERHPAETVELDIIAVGPDGDGEGRLVSASGAATGILDHVLRQLRPSLLVYISCDPESLARDRGRRNACDCRSARHGTNTGLKTQVTYFQ